MARNAQEISDGLDELYAARSAVLSNQAYEINGRKFTKANLRDIQFLIDTDEAKYAEMTGSAYTAKRPNLQAGWAS